jgi:flagellar motor switch protein FliM
VGKVTRFKILVGNVKTSQTTGWFTVINPYYIIEPITMELIVQDFLSLFVGFCIPLVGGLCNFFYFNKSFLFIKKK